MAFEIRPFQSTDEPAVVRLWTDCGLIVPWDDPHRDIRRKKTVQSESFLVGYTAKPIDLCRKENCDDR